MTSEYTGPERRQSSAGRDGRRGSDQHCPQHELLWKHHDDAARTTEGHLCRKITKVTTDLDSFQKETRTDLGKLSSSMTPWKVFALSMVVLIALVGWLAQKIDKGQDEIKASVGSIHQRITSNDKDVAVETGALKDALHQVNTSLQAVYSRIASVETTVEELKKKQTK